MLLAVGPCMEIAHRAVRVDEDEAIGIARHIPADGLPAEALGLRAQKVGGCPGDTSIVVGHHGGKAIEDPVGLP